MLKDYMEDYKRKKSDREENNREVEVFTRENGFEPVKWESLRIGQIIRVFSLFPCFEIQRKDWVTRDQFLPADILILNSSEPMGVCYIETKNLDGETNLKQKNAQKDVIRAFSRTEAILVRNSIKIFSYKQDRINKFPSLMNTPILFSTNFQVC